MGANTEDEGSGDVANQPEEPPSKRQSRKSLPSKTPNRAPLSLGLFLRTLDGSSETPGRIIMMTSNRIELLDEAFKRPGRVKKVQFDNLTYEELKAMILHFRPYEGHVPTVFIWTMAVNKLARMVVNDFDTLQNFRVSDLDNRGLGLSPALLEEYCMESQSLKQLFALLIKELETQHKKLLNTEQECQQKRIPDSVDVVRAFDWRMNALRQTVLFHITDPKNLEEASTLWPETQFDASVSRQRTDVEARVQRMLDDEEKFNMAIEVCPQDHSYLHPELQYRLQMELALDSVVGQEDTNLESILKILLSELVDKWALAWSTRDVELQTLLQTEKPPCTTFGAQQVTRW